MVICMSCWARYFSYPWLCVRKITKSSSSGNRENWQLLRTRYLGRISDRHYFTSPIKVRKVKQILFYNGTIVVSSIFCLTSGWYTYIEWVVMLFRTSQINVMIYSWPSNLKKLKQCWKFVSRTIVMWNIIWKIVS